MWLINSGEHRVAAAAAALNNGNEAESAVQARVAFQQTVMSLRKVNSGFFRFHPSSVLLSVNRLLVFEECVGSLKRVVDRRCGEGRILEEVFYEPIYG